MNERANCFLERNDKLDGALLTFDVLGLLLSRAGHLSPPSSLGLFFLFCLIIRRWQLGGEDREGRLQREVGPHPQGNHARSPQLRCRL